MGPGDGEERLKEDGGRWCGTLWAAEKSVAREGVFGDAMVEEDVEVAGGGGKPLNCAISAEYWVRRRLVWSLRSEAELREPEFSSGGLGVRSRPLNILRVVFAS